MYIGEIKGTRGGEVKIQVALDILDLDKAISVAEKAAKGGADLIEVGTILVKSEGIRVIRALSKTFDIPTVVDFKTWDNGYGEVELAAEAGADKVIILGAAGDRTVKRAMEASEDYGVEVIADMEHCHDPHMRVKRLYELGVRSIEIHVGWDNQPYNSINEQLKKIISTNLDLEISVAGGLTPEKISTMYNVDIFVVGKYIWNHSDPLAATKLCKQSSFENRQKPHCGNEQDKGGL